MKFLLVLCSLTIACLGLSQAAEKVIKDSQGMDCYVYLPDQIDPQKTYQLVVGVHGAGGQGKGAAGMASWAKRGDVIVIGPSFILKPNAPGMTYYQMGDGVHAEKLLKLFKDLGEEYRLRDKMFLHGFSGGSQFVHRFTMENHKYVCGVSAHSGGSWATRNYGKISKRTKDIPFAISCGEKDTKKSTPDSPLGRLDWYKEFRDEIDSHKFTYIGATWPDVGHRMSPGAWDLARQCFQIATGLPGGDDGKPVEISPDWKNLPAGANKPALAQREQQAPQLPNVSQAELDQVLPASFSRANTEKLSNEQLVNFMKRYPPALWKNREGSEKLLEQCQAAAEAWLAAAKEKNLLNDAAKKQFDTFSAGLKFE